MHGLLYFITILMCGIAGIFDGDRAPDRSLLERMASSLTKRGPDAGGFFVNGAAAVAHRRLSVIDLQTGDQPIYNEDRTLALVCNGEIYDYAELRSELISKGHTFYTESDSEVLLHLYEEHGPEMLDAVNGMFAFAILHVDTGDFFMARDRLGQKPLFYASVPRRFAFASGPSALKALDWVDTTFEPAAIHDYLEYQYIPTPRSIFRGVCKLPPGHRAFWKNHELLVEPYWRPAMTADFHSDYGAAKAELDSRLRAAVRRRLVADVPLGIFLSGGVDSSLICALAHEVGGNRPKTFSIGFPEKKYDERDYAAQVAAHFGTEHHFLEVSPNDFDRLSRIVVDFEEPFCDASMLPTSLLSEFTRRHVTVALSGDGADELFGGYYRYRIMKLCEKLRLIPAALRRRVSRSLQYVMPPRTEERTFWGRARRLLDISENDGLDRYLRLISRCPSPLKESLYGDRMGATGSLGKSVDVLSRHRDRNSFQEPIDELMEIDIKTYLTDDILVKVDRASMAYGLEVRNPFLDVEVVELALSLPYDWKQRGARRKRILVDTFAGSLPPGIAGRRKMGFGVPIARWLRQEWKEPMRELLLNGRLVGDGYFRKDRLSWLIQSHLERQADYSYTIFALIVLELWMMGGNG